MYGASRKVPRPIYGTSPRTPCVAKVPTDMDINTYIRSLEQVMVALVTHNNKQAAIENIQIIETNIDRAVNTT